MSRNQKNRQLKENGEDDPEVTKLKKIILKVLKEHEESMSSVSVNDGVTALNSAGLLYLIYRFNNTAEESSKTTLKTNMVNKNCNILNMEIKRFMVEHNWN